MFIQYLGEVLKALANLVAMSGEIPALPLMIEERFGLVINNFCAASDIVRLSGSK
jgi:hypothetical protein